MNREPIIVLGDILKSELNLADGQIMLSNQKWNIPQNPGLYIALSYLGGKAIGNNSYVVDVPSGMEEILSVTMFYMVQVDIMSFGPEALTRKEEVIMALRSVLSQQLQESNDMQVGRISGNFTDVSMLEETSMLNRYTMTVNVTALQTKRKAVPYYDTFSEPEVVVNA